MPDAIPHSVLPTVLDHCTPAIQGEDDDFYDFLCMYSALPCVYKRRRRALSLGYHLIIHTRNSQNTHTRSPEHDIGTRLNQLLI